MRKRKASRYKGILAKPIAPLARATLAITGKSQGEHLAKEAMKRMLALFDHYGIERRSGEAPDWFNLCLALATEHSHKTATGFTGKLSFFGSWNRR